MQMTAARYSLSAALLDTDASFCYPRRCQWPERPVLDASSDKAGFYYRPDGENGDIAQLGERCVRIAEVGGSNPPISTMPL
jgi:hypothetical protein